MVKASDIITLMNTYLNDKKLDCLEALYLWSKGMPSSTIAPLLRIKYGVDTGYITITNDLSSLKITRETEQTEDTKEPINMVIENIFSLKCVPEFLDAITEKSKVMTERSKYLMTTLLRSGLFERGEIKPEEVLLAYHSLFGQPLTAFVFREALTDLERLGVVYCMRSTYGEGVEKIVVPRYVFGILPQIESKLPKVDITEGKE
jgi:hypothetical protein